MSEGMSEPLSKQVCAIKADKHFITGAIWNSGYGDTYEIGVRVIADGRFFLIQKDGLNSHNINLACEAIRTLLNNGFTPGEVQRVLA